MDIIHHCTPNISQVKSRKANAFVAAARGRHAGQANKCAALPPTVAATGRRYSVLLNDKFLNLDWR